MGKALVVEDLHKAYGGRVRALSGVSFSVEEGEVFGLIGPNGAGKTTTLRIVAGLLKPDRGSVRVLGVDPFASPRAAKALIGYLPEDADVYSRLTGVEHLRLYARLYGAKSVEELVELGSKISGLGEALNKEAGEYSKGMKRRLLLAVALMKRPRLAVLDEPTAGLDVYSSIAVRELIKRYAKGEGAAVLLSSHNMLEVEYLCDRVAFINRGRIVEEGTPRELKEKYGASNLEEVFVAATGGARGA